MTYETKLIQEQNVTIPIEQLLAIDVSSYVEPRFESQEYEGNKPKNISEVLASYAYAKLSKRDRGISGDTLKKIEFNKLACVVYFAWYKFAWSSEE